MKKRVLFVISGLEAGGVEVMLKNTIDKFNTEYYEVVGVACISDVKDDMIVKEIEKKGYPIWFFGRNKLKDFIEACVDLEHLIKDEEVDLVHSFMFHANIISRCAVQFKKGCKLINAQRNVDTWRKWYHNLIDLFSSHIVDGFICCSNAVKYDYNKRTKINLNKIDVVHNGVDVNNFFKVYHKDKKEYIIGIVASLTKQKGHEYFLHAADSLLDLRRDVKFVIVGDGPLKNDLIQLAKNLNIDKKVEFVGVQDSKKWYKKFDVFWLTSRWEGLGNVVLEANASQLPVVAHRIDGIPEMIHHDKNGYLVSKGHTTKISYLTNELLNNPKKRNEMGKLGRYIVNKNFSLDSHVSKTIEIWDEVFENE